MIELNREAILSSKPKLKAVEVHTWGGTVFIRPITLAEQALFADIALNRDAKSGTGDVVRKVIVPLIIAVVSDKDGKPLFKVEDASEVERLDAGSLQKLHTAIMEYSGLTEVARKALEKNLQTDPNGEADSQ